MPKAYVAPSLRLPHTMGYSELVTIVSGAVAKGVILYIGNTKPNFGSPKFNDCVPFFLLIVTAKLLFYAGPTCFGRETKTGILLVLAFFSR